MEKIIFKPELLPSVTVLSNDFIDEHMAKADGEYVKIYLLILRYATIGQSLSVEELADKLDLTRKDVMRAINYWQKEGLIDFDLETASKAQVDSMQDSTKKTEDPSNMTTGSKDTATGAKTPIGPDTSVGHGTNVDSETSVGYGTSVHSGTSVGYGTPAASGTPAGLASAAQASAMFDRKHAPLKPSRNPVDLSEKVDGSELNMTVFMAESYLGKPLNPTELNSLVYIYEDLHFSTELLEYLIEYCVSKGKKSVRYMEVVAINWYEDGIDTVPKAKAQSNQYNQNVFSIMRALGLGNRNPVKDELDYIQQWNDMGFSLEVITEACNKTILQIQQPSFPYTNRILQGWFAEGVSTLEDVKKLDAHFQAEKTKNNAAEANASANQGKPPSEQQGSSPTIQTPKANAFHNFQQRNYDYNDLQSQLLKKNRRS